MLTYLRLCICIQRNLGQVGLTTRGQGGRESTDHSLSAQAGPFVMGMVFCSQSQALGTCHGTSVLAPGGHKDPGGLWCGQPLGFLQWHLGSYADTVQSQCNWDEGVSEPRFFQGLLSVLMGKCASPRAGWGWCGAFPSGQLDPGL